MENQTEEIKHETFDNFGLSKNILRGVVEAGFKIPSPIQSASIPSIMEGKDLIAQAQTGTGKTAAFGLPIMNKLGKNRGVEILVITPTRELASQVSDELFKLGRFANVKTVPIYGGQSISRQVRLVSQNAQVVVATPGRLLDHLKSKRLKRFAPTMVVLDEADEMLDMGFIDDIKEIFEFLPKERQTLLFSATMPVEIKKLAGTILTDPIKISCTTDKATPVDIEQRYYVIKEYERLDAIIRLMDGEEPEKSIVFCRTKREADILNTTLVSRGISSSALHGDMKQDQREETIRKFKKNVIETLVATDVAARGLDVSDVTHVFNYHIPLYAESYVHRIGRTGRAGKKGIAITMVTPLEYKKLKRIMAVTKATITHDNIPTLKDIKTKSYTKLIEKIASAKAKDNTDSILQVLEEEFSLSKIANKLLTLLIDNQNFSGPERIGMTIKELYAQNAKINDPKRRKNKKSPYGNKSKNHSKAPYKSKSRRTQGK